MGQDGRIIKHDHLSLSTDPRSARLAKVVNDRANFVGIGLVDLIKAKGEYRTISSPRHRVRLALLARETQIETARTGLPTHSAAMITSLGMCH